MNRFTKALLITSTILAGYTAKAQYCTTGLYSSGCTAFGDAMQSFSTTGGSTNITNLNTGCNGMSYNYYTGANMVHTAAPTQTVGFTIVNAPADNEYYTIFVDWNQDFDFDDAGENVYTTYLAIGATVSNSFVVPPSATPGTTRLRVRCDYGSAALPCGQVSWGETEDYNFVISGNCTSPASAATTAISSKAVSFNWAAVVNSLGYEYAITTTSNPPASGTVVGATITSASFNNLNPSTQYWLHVRNKCSTFPSAWRTITFTTLPPCVIPPGLKIPQVDSSSATILWLPVTTATSYQYIVNTTPQTPAANATFTSTPQPQAIVTTGLVHGKMNYIHIRAICVGDDSSAWVLDSFYVPRPCKQAQVQFQMVTSNRGVAYWNQPETAVSYSTAISKDPADPVAGIPVKQPSYVFNFLDPKTSYYVFVQCNCDDRGILTKSAWSKAEMITLGVDVNNVHANDNPVALYPNPAKDHVIINFNSSSFEGGQVSLLDINGKEIKSVTITAGETKIDVHDIAQGVYILKYVNNEVTGMARFIKN